ncbi:MAG: dodecin family protein [Bacillota bacterium]
MTVVKVLELVGESDKDWTDAVNNAVAEAAKTVSNLQGVEVYNWTANIQDGRIVEYKANVKVAFAVDGNKRKF